MKSIPFNPDIVNDFLINQTENKSQKLQQAIRLMHQACIMASCCSNEEQDIFTCFLRNHIQNSGMKS